MCVSQWRSAKREESTRAGRRRLTDPPGRRVSTILAEGVGVDDDENPILVRTSHATTYLELIPLLAILVLGIYSYINLRRVDSNLGTS
jgi:hypothetical protein